ncbi:hypothetical protein P7K49_005607 [Saguinus oedipus]|uniref:Uncharacterized protein n=1 Tax=Saguinus oedipus TaxID=9490 RepID=A0ABQ9W3N4_SAGOE|nr:hypothetical protein P7K49_005607 [Saguinus oedipus]
MPNTGKRDEVYLRRIGGVSPASKKDKCFRKIEREQQRGRGHVADESEMGTAVL